MSILVQVGGILKPEVDQDTLAVATAKFVNKMEAVGGFQKAVQLLNPETRFFQGLLYFKDDQSAGAFLEGSDFAHFNLFDPLTVGNDITVARLAVVE